jgi:transcriptional activator HAC1
MALPDSLLTPSALDTFGVSASTPTGGYVDESGLLASPDASHFEYDHLVRDDSAAYYPGGSQYDHFDITEFLTDDINLSSTGERQQQQHGPSDRAGAGLSLPDFATTESSADPFLQPPSGASLEGCDVGGIAVGGL